MSTKNIKMKSIKYLISKVDFKSYLSRDTLLLNVKSKQQVEGLVKNSVHYSL